MTPTPTPTPATATATATATAICDELAEQVDALRRAADLLERAAMPGLSLTFDDDRIGIQVGRELGDATERTAVVTHLADLLGSRARRRGGRDALADWIIADGQLAGHRVHIFTAIGDTYP
jgi:hypothetical protein